MNRKVKSMKNNRVSIAVIQTDLKWIQNKLIDIEKKVDNVQACTKGHDDRIQKLEDETRIGKEQREQLFKEKQMSITKLGLIVAGITAAINILCWLVERALGG